ncbi:MAG: TrmB family transcriptional regulator [Euryarchaeota archaeon]|nr:TrmB family transcriptional regulator [Euryarchaeota archaeon]
MSTEKLLLRLGFTEAEARVYIELLRKGTATAGELAKATRHSRTQVYEILEKLQHRGLVESHPARPARFRALDPVVALPALTSQKRRELEVIEKALLRLLPELWNTRSAEEARIFIGRGIEKVYVKVLEMLGQAEESIYSFMGWISAEESHRLLQAFRSAEERGVEVFLVVHQNPAFRESADRETLLRFAEHATKFCLVPSTSLPLPPLKLLYVDGMEVCIAFGDFLETGTLRDAISVHYHRIPAVYAVARRIAPLYFNEVYSRFGGDEGDNRG